MTILGPLFMGALMTAVIYMAIAGSETISVVKVIDETPQQIFAAKLKSNRGVIYEIEKINIDSARKRFDAELTYGILYIPASVINSPNTFMLYTEKKASITVVSNIEKDLQALFEEYKMRGAGIDPAVLSQIKTDVTVRQQSIEGEEESNAGATAVIGFVGGLLIYMFTFIYGAQVMRGVMEEKQSRIVEVIMSSVKPFQLMMGKIIGIALVALTQFLMWVVLTAVITIGITTYIAGTKPDIRNQIEKVQQDRMMLDSQAKAQMDNFKNENIDISKMMGSFNVTKILLMFVFYFIGGYLMYAALFAAIGAAVDSETDVQQFMVPITVPLIFAYIASTVVMQNPESSMGFWFSIIPFTSPIVMMVRMPFDPPVFDVVLSMALLVAGFIATTWLAAKIYRTGILMYGKKVTYKELAKWITYKG